MAAALQGHPENDIVSFPVKWTVQNWSFPASVDVDDGRQSAQGIVWSVFVVLADPLAGDLAHLLERAEQVHVQHFIAVDSDEPLDVGILVRFARFDVVNHHAVFSHPLDEHVTEQLRSIVDTQDLRQAPVVADSLEQANQALASQRGVDLDADGQVTTSQESSEPDEYSNVFDLRRYRRTVHEARPLLTRTAWIHLTYDPSPSSIDGPQIERQLEREMEGSWAGYDPAQLRDEYNQRQLRMESIHRRQQLAEVSESLEECNSQGDTYEAPPDASTRHQPSLPEGHAMPTTASPRDAL